MIDADLIARARDADLLATAERLGSKLKKVATSEWAGNCPKCGGRDRFSVNVKRQVWNCRGCGKGGDSNALDLVMHFNEIDFREAVAFLTGENTKRPQPAPQAPRPVAEPDNGDNRERALALWRASGDPRGTPAQTYLESRALTLDDQIVVRVLRWNDRIGAMVALFRNTETNQPQAISRTFLDREGNKLGRKFLGPTSGAAVKLDPDENVLGGLHAGEGIETGMAARAFGLRPAWALGSAGAIAVFPVLNGVECLSLLAEHDKASARAVQACAERWHAAGREVLINRPLGGKDLNDVYKVSA